MTWIILDSDGTRPTMAVDLNRIGAWHVLPDKLRIIVDGHDLRIDLAHPQTQALLDQLLAAVTPKPPRPAPEDRSTARQLARGVQDQPDHS